MSIKGLDVSEFQGEVDWERVKAAGFRFAMLRAGYGSNTIDKQFRRNAAECNRIGLPIGAYWFCYAFSVEKARKEADGCINTISEYRLDYPVCYDIEQASADYIEKQGVSFTPALARNVVTSFCSHVEKKGYFAMFCPLREPIRWNRLRNLAVHQYRQYSRHQRQCGLGHRICRLSRCHKSCRPQSSVRKSSCTLALSPVYHLCDPARRHFKRHCPKIRHNSEHSDTAQRSLQSG